MNLRVTWLRFLDRVRPRPGIGGPSPRVATASPAEARRMEEILRRHRGPHAAGISDPALDRVVEAALALVSAAAWKGFEDVSPQWQALYDAVSYAAVEGPDARGSANSAA